MLVLDSNQEALVNRKKEMTPVVGIPERIRNHLLARARIPQQAPVPRLALPAPEQEKWSEKEVLGQLIDEAASKLCENGSDKFQNLLKKTLELR